MMSVILISDSAFDFEGLAVLYSSLGRVVAFGNGGFRVYGVWGWFSFEEDEYVEGEYEPAELARVRDTFQQPFFAMLQHSTDEAVVIALSNLVVNQSILVDNDHGLLLKLEEVKKRIWDGREWLRTAQ